MYRGTTLCHLAGAWPDLTTSQAGSGESFESLVIQFDEEDGATSLPEIWCSYQRYPRGLHARREPSWCHRARVLDAEPPGAAEGTQAKPEFIETGMSE